MKGCHRDTTNSNDGVFCTLYLVHGVAVFESFNPHSTVNYCVCAYQCTMRCIFDQFRMCAKR